jgi:hypothetical protein
MRNTAASCFRSRRIGGDNPLLAPREKPGADRTGVEISDSEAVGLALDAAMFSNAAEDAANPRRRDLFLRMVVNGNLVSATEPLMALGHGRCGRLSRFTGRIIIGGVAAGTSAGIATLHFCGTTSEKCEVAHTSPRLAPLKSGY